MKIEFRDLLSFVASLRQFKNQIARLHTMYSPILRQHGDMDAYPLLSPGNSLDWDLGRSREQLLKAVDVIDCGLL